MEHILIIGGVAAGPKAACRLKRLQPDARITLIDQDDLISYGGCGIPYFIGGDVGDESALRSTSFHMIRDETYFRDAKGIDVKTCTKAVSINRDRKTVSVEYLGTKEQEELNYDKLVLATGSRPNILNIPGNDLRGIFSIGSLNSALNLQKWLSKEHIERAVVIGGGAIGIEMAEGIEDMWGLETTIVEFFPKLLPNFVDWPFAKMLKNHLEENNISVFTGEGVEAINGDDEGNVAAVVTSNREIKAEVVIMATGVRSRDELAREAGILVSPRGGIIVNERMQTSDPNIYAAGDCVESMQIISGRKAFAPLGSLANRQGRVVADNLAGIASRFPGISGSFVMKAYERSIGSIGLTYEAAKAEGYDAEKAITIQSDRAHFFPNQQAMPLMMVFDKSTRKVLGLQGFGAMGDNVLARIDAAAGLLAKGATIEDFSNLEMAYAPPFSTAVDALNATANVADNLARGRLRNVRIEAFIEWIETPASHPDWIAIDLRGDRESASLCSQFGERWVSIPYPEMRKRHEELPRDRELILVCGAGTRSYEVQVLLDSLGKKNTLVLPGGTMVLKRLGVIDTPD